VTPDEFLDRYITPFEVRGQDLEVVPSLYDFYRELMLRCTTLREMQEVALEFKFLAMGVLGDLSTVQGDVAVPRLKKLLTTDAKPEPHLQNFKSPPAMTEGRKLARVWGLPEYYGALQYARSKLKDGECF